MRPCRPRTVHRVAAMAAVTLFVLGGAGQAWAEYPGANGKLAFTSDRNAPDPQNIANTDIYSMEPDGSGLTRLTTTPNGRQSVDPEWSADGERIVFASNLHDTNPDPFDTLPFEIYAVQGDGTGLVRLTNDNSFDRFPSWSPDGTKIAYNADGLIKIINSDGTGGTVVGGGEYPEWSPDGSRIAFASGGALAVVNPDGSGFTTLTSGLGGQDLEPEWSPDGSKIAFRRETSGVGSNIWVMNADGTGQTQLTFSGLDEWPSWSPDGTKIAFQRERNITIMNADGSDPTPVFDTPTNDFHTTWQPLPNADTDADDDGIDDSVDPDPSTPSAAFDDGDGNSGSITANPASLAVAITDLAAPDGVRVTVGAGAGQVTMSVCGGFTLKVSAGSEVEVTCGSVSVQVVEGEAQIELGGGLTVVTVPAGSAAKVSENDDGSFEVQNVGGGTIAVTVDGVETSIASGETNNVTALDFQGFSSPVDNPDTLNVVDSGQIVPLKWRLLAADGTPFTGLTAATIRASALACGLGDTTDLLEEAAPGASGLKNLGSGYYQLNWKTPKSYARSCKTLELDIGEGVTRDAWFKFAR